MFKFTQTVALALTILTPVSASAATLIGRWDGQLTGALGVDVDGMSYDVTFVEGSCIELFNGCDASSDFVFTNLGTAESASQALLDQVFIDGAQGQFDSRPDLTLSGGNWFLTPWKFELLGRDEVTSAVAVNLYAEQVDFVIGVGLTPNHTGLTYALWAPTVVPVPAAGFLLMAALAGLALNSRFASNKSAHSCLAESELS